MEAKQPSFTVRDILEGKPPLVIFPPDLPIAEALRVMVSRGYSQVGVGEQGDISGLFSLRNLAGSIAAYGAAHLDSATVGGLAEGWEEAAPDASILDVARRLQNVDSIVVRGSDRVHILTDHDIMAHYHDRATVFLIVEAIELQLRAIIARALPVSELNQFAEHAFKGKYAKLPRIEELEFSDYNRIVSSSTTWGRFDPVFRTPRALVNRRLEFARLERNRALHFRDGADAFNLRELRNIRKWLTECGVRAGHSDQSVQVT